MIFISLHILYPAVILHNVSGSLILTSKSGDNLLYIYFSQVIASRGQYRVPVCHTIPSNCRHTSSNIYHLQTFQNPQMWHHVIRLPIVNPGQSRWAIILVKPGLQWQVFAHDCTCFSVKVLQVLDVPVCCPHVIWDQWYCNRFVAMIFLGTDKGDVHMADKGIHGQPVSVPPVQLGWYSQISQKFIVVIFTTYWYSFSAG